MSRLFRRSVVFLVALIAFLQFIHYTLLSRLKNTDNKDDIENEYENISRRASYDSNDNNEQYTGDDVRKDRELMYKSLQSLSSVLDFSGEYRIIKNFVPAQALNVFINKGSKIRTLDGFDPNQNSYRRNDISLVSHSTIYHLYNLRLLSKRWSGLISVAAFAVSFEELPLLIETILLLRFCNARIRHRTSFHLVYPLNITSFGNLPDQQSILKLVKSSIIDTGQWSSSGLCTRQDLSTFRTITAQLNYDHAVLYPNNLLRNIAKRYSFTQYNLVIDIDLVPSDRLYEHFLEFAGRSSLLQNSSSPKYVWPKVVFVLPTYEINIERPGKLTVQQEDNFIPKTKKELQDSIKNKLVRPFYIELCWKCQKYTDYEAWLQIALANNSTDNSNRIDILYDVHWHDPWEPFYIGSKDVPFYDERFRQYGFNRISQVCELNMAEYRFAVIDNAFLVHKGFKEQRGFHSQKDLELERNRILFRQFKAELRERYPKSTRRC